MFKCLLCIKKENIVFVLVQGKKEKSKLIYLINITMLSIFYFCVQCTTKPPLSLMLDSYYEVMGLDLDHNRFLILQGEVEQIAKAKENKLCSNTKSEIDKNM